MATKTVCEEPDNKKREASREQLKIAEAWHRAILHDAPDGMLVIDGHGKISLANAELARIFGYSEDELIGQPVELLVPEDLRQAHVGRCKAGGGMREEQVRALSGNLRARHKDGSEFAVDLVLSRLPQAISHLGTLCATVREIIQRKRMEVALAARAAQHRENSSLLKAVLESFPDVIVFALDKAYRYLAFNEKHRNAMRAIWGREIAPGMSILDLFGEHPNRENARLAFDRALAGGSFVTEVANGDGAHARFFWRIHLSPVRNETGCILGLTCLSIDITERKRIEAALAEREHEFRILIEKSPDTVARYGRDLRRLYVNPVYAALVEGGERALIGKTPSECPGGPNSRIYENNLAEVFVSEKEREFELIWTDKSGRECCSLIRLTPEFGKDGTVERVLAIGRSTTELYAARQTIHQMAFYDSLTSLPNRALFNDRLRRMIADASWRGERAGVMLVDMDRFKAVNDAMGHMVGDELLCETAARLTSCMRSCDTVARLGADEFAILLPEICHGDDLGRIASKILGKFDEHFLLDGKEVCVSCSIGIAVYPDDSTEAHDLMRYADSAMCFAKRSGRNNARFYSKDLTASARERLTLESELRHAMVRGQLALHYQPKVLLENGTIIGSEALLRWCHPQLGMVPPGQFIQVAEDTRLIVDIGNWVLREACRTASDWNADGGPLHKVAINLSARQFETGDLAATVAAILEETTCRPVWIELEITESLLLDENGKTLEILTGLRAMGITIAIDDFGTGYSALNYLARFPIDTLKIDRSFIHSITTEKKRAELVKGILSIACCLGQDVVAEGVETAEQAEFLQAHGCKVAQGYLYSKPLPKADVASLPRQFSSAS